MKARKLGRGLDILLDKAKGFRGGGGAEAASEASERRSRLDDALGADADESAEDVQHAAATAADSRGDTPRPADSGDDRDEVRQLPVASIDPNPHQPRHAFDHKEMEALKSSVARDGILQPVLVRGTGGGRYQLVAGERRFRAAGELGLETVPALVIEVEDARMLELALVENIHRENLNPIETARAFEGLMGLRGWTQEDLAKHLGLGRSTVANYLRLLGLPSNIQRALAKGQIEMGHAKILLTLPEGEDQQVLFEKIAEDRLTVRELEVAREATAPSPKRPGTKRERPRRRRASPAKSAEVLKLEDELSEALGAKVRIDEKKGRGVLHIEFYSPEDFEHLRALLVARRPRA